MSINRVIEQGRLVRDPELKEVGAKSTKLTTGCIAVDNPYDDKSGFFFNFEAWEKNAENIAKWFKKGDEITIDGSLKSENYEDKDGNKRNAVKIVVQQWSFGRKKGDGKKSDQSAPAEQKQAAPSSGLDDETPF